MYPEVCIQNPTQCLINIGSKKTYFSPPPSIKRSRNQNNGMSSVRQLVLNNVPFDPSVPSTNEFKGNLSMIYGTPPSSLKSNQSPSKRRLSPNQSTGRRLFM